MLKKTITFEDLDGNKVTEDFYFNLNQAELAEWELRYEGGLEKHLRAIVAKRDGNAIIEAFKSIIEKTVGLRSADGRRFVKTKEISEEFMQTDAYSQLFISLVTDANAAAEFIKGVVPASMSQKLEASEAKSPLSPEAEARLADAMGLPSVQPNLTVTSDLRSAWERENREATTQEIVSMSDSEIARYRTYLRHKK